MNKAVVLLSGGQDSTTALFWAKTKWQDVSAVSFDYGQRHKKELIAAQQIAAIAQVPHQVLTLSLSDSPNALTTPTVTVDALMPTQQRPATFVPGRNLIMLALAAAHGMLQKRSNLVIGVCEADFNGYPDCRQTTLKAMEQALQLGMDWPELTIHAPFVLTSKANQIALAAQLGNDCWRALAKSWTCYVGSDKPCGQCSSCVERAKGFAAAGMQDPASAGETVCD